MRAMQDTDLTASAPAFESIDPTTGRRLSTFPAATPDAIETAIADAAATAPRWAAASFAERGEVLLRVARLLDQDEQDLAALMVREMGKPWHQALAEVRKCAWTVRHFAEHAEALLAPEPVRTEATASGVVYQPLGVLFGIMPWNFPLWQVFRFAAPALMAGNVAIVKHAPSTMGCGEAVSALFQKAGAPRGLLRHLPLTVEAAAAVIADPRVAAVTVTGSTRAGRAVASLAGQHLKPVVLELGGSDPFLVMPSADLDAAARVLVQSRTGNNGQSCIAAKRLIAHAAIAEPLLARVRDLMAALRVGNPMDESVDVGPLASEAARATLHAQVRAAIDAGAHCALGGAPLPGPGFFYAPTLLTDVPPTSPAAREELFGPVLSAFTATDLDHAVALANDSDYGLTATIFTRDAAEIDAATHRLAVGAVFANAMSRSDPRLPFGGIRQSGFGRELGRAGLLSFCNVKTYWYT